MRHRDHGKNGNPFIVVLGSHEKKLASAAFATMLAWGTPSLAIPAGGPPPPPDCAADIEGHLTATPPAIDRDTSNNPVTSLAWSITGPSCPVSFALEDSSVGRSGKKSFQVTRTRTFSLTLPRLHRTLARVTVTVAGDPGF